MKTVNARTRRIAALACNVLLFVLEIVANLINWHDTGLPMFKFYTVDSNLLSLAASGIFLVYGIRGLKRGQPVPRFVRILRFVATCCLTVTLTVVVTVLYPMLGNLRYLLFAGGLLYNHTLCPVLAIITFLFFEQEPALKDRDVLWTVGATLLYGAAAVILNLARVLYGPYPFLHVYEMPVWMSAMWYVLIVGGAAALSWVLVRLNRMIAKKTIGKERSLYE